MLAADTPTFPNESSGALAARADMDDVFEGVVTSAKDVDTEIYQSIFSRYAVSNTTVLVDNLTRRLVGSSVWIDSGFGWDTIIRGANLP